MAKKAKGFVLTESIIAITVLATVITVVYGITINYYVKQDNSITKYNTTQGLYSAKDVKTYFKQYEDTLSTELISVDYVDKTGTLCGNLCTDLNISKLFLVNHNAAAITNFMNSGSGIPNNLKSQILNEDFEENACKYDYVIIYNDDSYAVIGAGCYE